MVSAGFGEGERRASAARRKRYLFPGTWTDGGVCIRICGRTKGKRNMTSSGSIFDLLTGKPYASSVFTANRNLFQQEKSFSLLTFVAGTLFSVFCHYVLIIWAPPGSETAPWPHVQVANKTERGGGGERGAAEDEDSSPTSQGSTDRIQLCPSVL